MRCGGSSKAPFLRFERYVKSCNAKSADLKVPAFFLHHCVNARFRFCKVHFRRYSEYFLWIGGARVAILLPLSLQRSPLRRAFRTIWSFSTCLFQLDQRHTHSRFQPNQVKLWIWQRSLGTNQLYCCFFLCHSAPFAPRKCATFETGGASGAKRVARCLA